MSNKKSNLLIYWRQIINHIKNVAILYKFERRSRKSNGTRRVTINTQRTICYRIGQLYDANSVLVAIFIRSYNLFCSCHNCNRYFRIWNILLWNIYMHRNCKFNTIYNIQSMFYRYRKIN